MKRTIITLAMAAAAWLGTNAMSYERAREEALYLTDKMAYELNLNDQQYNDAYEINLDYLMSLDDERDLYGRYLEYRLGDLRHILFDWQYDLMLAADYFVRPVIWRATGWYFPIYAHYRYGWFYYDRPAVFWNYRGGHGHLHFHDGNYYANRRPAWHGGMRGMDRNRGNWNSPTPRNGQGNMRMHNGQNVRGSGVPNGRGGFSGTRDNAHTNSQGTFRPGSNRGTDSRTMSGNRGTDSRTVSGNRGTDSRTMSGNRGLGTGSHDVTTPTHSGVVSGGGTSSPSRGSASSSRGTVNSSSRGNLFNGSSTRSTVGGNRSNPGMSSGASRGNSGSRGGSVGGTRSAGGSSHGAGRGGRR